MYAGDSSLGGAVLLQAFELEKPECIAPAKPGGGHDIMCQLLAASVADSLLIDMSIRFMPGGIGALAFNHAVSVRPKDANMVVAVPVEVQRSILPCINLENTQKPMSAGLMLLARTTG